MSNEKMTPGPWKLGELSGEVLTATGRSVAAPPDCYSDEQWQIDARAIAAVPELIEALRECERVLCGEEHNPDRVRDANRLARAALEKAGAL